MTLKLSIAFTKKVKCYSSSKFEFTFTMLGNCPVLEYHLKKLTMWENMQGENLPEGNFKETMNQVSIFQYSGKWLGGLN